jgi:hypothetical protein
MNTEWTLADRIRNRLVIASGTPYAIAAIDLRSLRDWRRGYGGAPVNPDDRLFVYHHTGSIYVPLRGIRQEIASLELEAASATWGLPYNFIVTPGRSPHVYYLNDVDHTSPHTTRHNHHTALCLRGNYDIQVPDKQAVALLTRTADALATMWRRYVPETLHSDFEATACPGSNLARLLEVRRNAY